MSVSSSRVVTGIAARSRSLVIAPQYQPGDEHRRNESSPEASRARMDGVPAVRVRLPLVRWWMGVQAVLVGTVTLMVARVVERIAAATDRRITPLALIRSESSRPMRLV